MRLAGALILLLAAAAVIVATDPFGSSGNANGAVADNSTPTSLATITRRSLSAQQDESGTLGYAGAYSVVNQARGTLTSLPSVGQVIAPGGVLYRVSDEPVVLLYGHTPAYRALAKGVEGPDVRELNTDLVALGYTSSEGIGSDSDYFGSETRYALERLQAKLGVKETGSLALGQAIFLPCPLRITKVLGTLGAQAPPGSPVAQASSTARQVVVNMGASSQGGVRKGDRVAITMPTGQTTPGIVTSVGTVAASPSSHGGEEGTPTIEIDITPIDPRATGHLDQAPVKISITTAAVAHALVVPVNALLALAGGGYAVEVAEGRIHHLVAVELGLFDDAEGLVQVSASGLAPGQHIVVPAS